jgi:hypothetical protein
MQRRVELDPELAVTGHLLPVGSDRSSYHDPFYYKLHTSCTSFYNLLCDTALTLADLAAAGGLVDIYTYSKVNLVLKKVLKIPSIYLDILEPSSIL